MSEELSPYSLKPTPDPYHVGYDQDEDSLPPYDSQNVIQMQPSGTASEQRPMIIYVVRGKDLTWPAIILTYICFPFFGLAATIYAVMAQNRYSEGRIQEAEKMQRRTRKLMALSVLFGIVLWVVLIILYWVEFRIQIEHKKEVLAKEHFK